MKKKLVLMTSALMAIGLFASFANHQGNTVRVEAIEPVDVTIAKRYSESYSMGGCYYVCFADETEDKIFSFRVENDAEVEQNHRLTPNKTYTLDKMTASKSSATISGEKFEYVTASLKLYSDENGYIGYEAEAELNNGVSYSLHEADPMSGKMVIDEYKYEYGEATLTDTETGSRFNFAINNIEDGATYTLSEFSGSKYCYIGDRYWNYREATFKRTTDDDGLIHVEATVLTEHGDSLSLKYNPIAVTGVALNKSSTTIKYGGNETLIATVSPDDADDKSVTWSSSDESVATVDEAGKVTAVSVGSAVVTVTTKDGEFKATCAVTVSESAVSVTNRINALPTPESVTLDDKDAIEAARKAYDSLDADEKALVTTETLKKLTDDEAAYQNLVDTAAANAVIEMIDLLPESSAVTLDDGNDILLVRAAYDVLTDVQKAKVPADKLQKLVDDEAAYTDLEAANKVVELINALPNASDVTKNDKETIEAARSAYESLTDAQKAKVPADKLQKLVDDENALKSISSGLPAGAIVGIVIGSVAVAGLGGFAIFWFVIKKKTWADFVAIFKKK